MPFHPDDFDQTPSGRPAISDGSAITGAGFRQLTDEDTLQRGDETLCVSTAHWEEWGAVDEEWADRLGQRIGDLPHDMDWGERMFRRRTNP